MTLPSADPATEANVNHLVTKAFHDSPEEALTALAHLKRWRDMAERDLVVMLRRQERRTWSYIGGCMGMSRRAVWERYANTANPADGPDT